MQIKWILASIFPFASSFEKMIKHQWKYQVSVIVPVFNAERYLRSCLDSLINQSLQNIEIICVNDGSDDGSLQILREYAAADERIKILSFEKIGPGGCRNVGIDAAQGEYICFVDADDFIDSNTCKTAYGKIKAEDAEVLSFNALEISKTGIRRIIYFDGRSEKIINWKDLNENIFSSPFHSWHFLFKRDFLLANAVYFADVYWCEDVPFVLLSLLAAKKIVLLPDYFYHYCRNESSLVCAGGDTRLSALYIISWLKYVFAQKKEYASLQKSLYDWICIHSCFAYNSLTENSRHYFCRKLKEKVDVKTFLKIKKHCSVVKVVKIFGLPLIKTVQFDNVLRVLFCNIPVISIRCKK